MSIFDTTAPTDFNSFGNPMNPANMNPGWSVNPNYLTPAFTAPYRPPYSGSVWSGFNSNPGFFRSAFGISPFNVRGTPYGIGNTEQNAAYWDSVGTKPNDFMAATSQRIAVPIAAYGAAMALSRAWQVPMGGGAAFGASRFLNAVTGGSKFATMSGFAGMGARLGGGLTEGLIGGAFGEGALAGGLARGAIGMGGALGAASFGIGVPLLLAQGAITASNRLIFDNYINAREGQNLSRRAFSGVTFGEGMGTPVTGQGINRAAAGIMGGQLASFGARDQVFTGREINTLTSMSSQMGLLDNVPGDQIVNRMKSITRQVKLIMSMADTPDFKEAINIMARLQSSGVGSNNMAGVFAGISNYASQAGISAGRLFNTMGAQGQYLFQSNGMTPYVGQLAAGNAAAGFASAWRQGLISNDLMARMGGVEGATQSSVTGQLAAAQTPYNAIRAYNKYTSGLGGQGVVQQISNFARSFAGNPLEAYGAYLRTGRANASRMLEEQGPMATYSQMRDIANVYIGNRAMTQNEMYAFGMPVMGNDMNSVQAFVTQMGIYQDPRAMQQMRAGSRASRIKMTRDFLEQTEQTYFMSSAPIREGLKAYRSASANIAESFGNFNARIGGAVDSLEGWATSKLVGSPDKMGGIGMNEAESDLRLPIVGYRVNGTFGASAGDVAFNKRLSQHQGDIEKLVRAAKHGNQAALGALQGNTYDIETASRNGTISSRYQNGSDKAALASMINELPRDMSSNLKGNLIEELGTSLDTGMFKGKSRTEAYQLYNTARDLFGAGDLRNLTGTDRQKLEGFMSATGTTMDTVRAKIDSAVKEGTLIGVDYAAKGDVRPGESLPDHLRRHNAYLRGKIENANDRTMTAKQAFIQAQGEEKHSRDAQMREAFIRTMMREGHVDLAAAYKMDGSVDKFDAAVDKFVGGIKNREATNTTDSDPSLASHASNGVFNPYSTIYNLFTKGPVK